MIIVVFGAIILSLTARARALDPLTGLLNRGIVFGSAAQVMLSHQRESVDKLARQRPIGESIMMRPCLTQGILRQVPGSASGL